VNTPLALNSNLTSERPTTCCAPSSTACASRRPRHRLHAAFREALDDRQIAELAGYMRARFAPQEPAWKTCPPKLRACARRRGTEALRR
jgi:nicotinate dehydrogenase subunit B